ncbi:MAG: hypothetical protein ACI81T_004384, partial [Bacteroidia bacterium]
WEAPLEPVLLLVFRVLTNSKNKQFLQILVLLYLLTKFTIEPYLLDFIDCSLMRRNQYPRDSPSNPESSASESCAANFREIAYQPERFLLQIQPLGQSLERNTNTSCLFTSIKAFKPNYLLRVV